MTQPPAPSPYGQSLPANPRRGRSNVFKFWMGVLLCIPVLFVVGALQAIPQAIAGASGLPSEVGQLSTLGLDLAIFAGFIAGLVVEKTRFVVLGVLAGMAVLFVIAAGACVLLLVGLSNGN